MYVLLGTFALNFCLLKIGFMILYGIWFFYFSFLRRFANDDFSQKLISFLKNPFTDFQKVYPQEDRLHPCVPAYSPGLFCLMPLSTVFEKVCRGNI